jgi:hypothetical protein
MKTKRSKKNNRLLLNPPALEVGKMYFCKTRFFKPVFVDWKNAKKHITQLVGEPELLGYLDNNNNYFLVVDVHRLGIYSAFKILSTKYVGWILVDMTSVYTSENIQELTPTSEISNIPNDNLP